MGREVVCVCVKENHNLGRPEVLRISGCICSVRVSDTTNWVPLVQGFTC